MTSLQAFFYWFGLLSFALLALLLTAAMLSSLYWKYEHSFWTWFYKTSFGSWVSSFKLERRLNNPEYDYPEIWPVEWLDKLAKLARSKRMLWVVEKARKKYHGGK